jgi:hypothetical protein
VKEARPGKGLFGWLGRQVGHVQKAVRTDPAAAPAPKIVYREDRVEEQVLPDQPGVKYRRTVIDEVIVEQTKALAGQMPAPDEAVKSEFRSPKAESNPNDEIRIPK